EPSRWRRSVPSEKSAGPPWRSDGGGRDSFGDGPAGRGPVLDPPDDDKSRDKHVAAAKGSAFGRGFDSRRLHQSPRRSRRGIVRQARTSGCAPASESPTSLPDAQDVPIPVRTEIH